MCSPQISPSRPPFLTSLHVVAPSLHLLLTFLCANQVDEKRKAKDFKAGNTVAASADEMTTVGTGDRGLTFAEFMEALVAVALQRANPDLGELGELEANDPLPGCLESLLKSSILTNAKRDKLALVKAAFETDGDVQAILPEIRARLQKTTPDSKSFDDVTKVGVRKVFGKQVMSMDMLQVRHLSASLRISPHPPPSMTIANLHLAGVDGRVAGRV